MKIGEFSTYSRKELLSEVRHLVLEQTTYALEVSNLKTVIESTKNKLQEIHDNYCHSDECPLWAHSKPTEKKNCTCWKSKLKELGLVK